MARTNKTRSLQAGGEDARQITSGLLLERRFDRAEMHAVMLADTLEFVASHCGNPHLSGVLRLQAMGVAQLQDAINAHLQGDPEQDGLDRITHLLPVLITSAAFLDEMSAAWSDLCGVIGLLNRSVNDLHDDVTAYLHATGTTDDAVSVSGRPHATSATVTKGGSHG